jgi:hypothetical protein
MPPQQDKALLDFVDNIRDFSPHDLCVFLVVSAVGQDFRGT